MFADSLRIHTRQIVVALLAAVIAFSLMPLPAYGSQDGGLMAGSAIMPGGDDDAELQAQDQDTSGDAPVYRIYNYLSGEHFYTMSKYERNHLMSIGWFYEGIGWMSPAQGDSVYRLYNPNAGDHHFTCSAYERDVLRKKGWRYEGEAFKTCAKDDPLAKPLLRQYNPNAKAGAHNFTLSDFEAKAVVRAGWRDEGIGWHGHLTPDTYQDDAEPWKPNISGDSELDRHIYIITKSHKSLKSCYNYVVNNFSYRSGNKFYSKPNALPNSRTISYAKEMINRGSGNCYRFASLFCWLARGLGYSANTMSGWVPSLSGGKAPHGWVEIYQGGKTYVCDPDLAHEIPGRNWYWFTYGSAPTTYGFW